MDEVDALLARLARRPARARVATPDDESRRRRRVGAPRRRAEPGRSRSEACDDGVPTAESDARLPSRSRRPAAGSASDRSSDGSTRADHVSRCRRRRRRSAALPLGAVDARLRRLPRRRVGAADPRRRRPLRAADPRGVPVGAVVADDPAQARELPGGLRRLRHRRGRGVRRRPTASGCSPTPASSATGPRSTRRWPTRARRWRSTSGSPTLIWRFAPDEPPGAVDLGDVPAQTAESTALAKELKRHGFRLRRPDDGVRADAGRRPGQRPPRRLLGAHRLEEEPRSRDRSDEPSSPSRRAGPRVGTARPCTTADGAHRARPLGASPRWPAAQQPCARSPRCRRPG